MKLMQTQFTDFSGQNVYVGLDVHKKSWSVTILTDEVEHKTFTSVPDADKLSAYLKKNFTNADFYSAYEAGFCGFGHHRRLNELGIKNIVVNAADVPSTSKEKITKIDKVDSRKIAKGLRSRTISGIYVMDVHREELRSLARQRQIFQRDLRRYKQRIKAYLHYMTIALPKELSRNNWSKAFESWLESLQFNSCYGKSTLENLLNGYRYHKQQVGRLNLELRKIIQREYSKQYDVLLTIPGIGTLTAIAIITELGDMSRFKQFNQLCSYVGLIPMTFSSGETERIGNMTYRCNNWLRPMIIESAWTTIQKDPAMLLYYKSLIARGVSPKRGVVKVARKLLSRIRYVLMHKKPYKVGLVANK